MTTLTWRDVVAPNLGNPQDSINSAAKLLASSTGGLSGALTQFDTAQSDIVNQQAQAALLRYQDPAELQAALKSGALFQGLDQSRIRPETMQNANGRVSTLLNNSINKENLQQGIYDNQYVNADRLRELDARQAFALNAQGNGGLPSSIVGQLSINEQSKLRTGNQTATSTQRTNNQNQENDDLASLSTSVVQSALSASATPNQFRNIIEGGNYTPKQKAAIYTSYEKATGKKLIGPDAFYDPFDTTKVNRAGALIDAAVNPTASNSLGGAAWAKAKGLTANESGGNTAAENNAVGSGGKVGHFGLLQFGQDRLADAKAAGVIPKDMTPQEFSDSGAETQNKVADWHFADIDKQAETAGLNNYFGKVIKGVVIDRDAIRGMAHIGGIGGVKKFISTNGEYDKADVNGTKISDYGKKFGGSLVPTNNASTALLSAASGIPPVQPVVQAQAPVITPPIPLTQAQSDRQKLLGTNEDIGRAIADMGMLIPRAIVGANDSTIVRGMKALGLPVDYMGPRLVPNGVDPTSMTPYTDQKRAQELLANPPTPVITPPTNKPAALLAAASEVPKLKSVAEAEMLQASQEQQGSKKIDQDDPSNLSRFMETFKSGPGDDGGFIEELIDSPSFKNNGAERSDVTSMFYKIKEATGQPGAVVASAMKHLAKTDEYGRGFNWLLEKPFSNEGSTDSLGKNIGVSERKLANMINFLKTNEVDNVVMNNKGIKASDVELQKQLGIAKALEANLLVESAKATSGVPNAAERVKLMQAQLQVELDKYQALTRKRQSNSAFVPKKL